MAEHVISDSSVRVENEENVEEDESKKHVKVNLQSVRYFLLKKCEKNRN